jgi:hypothetical protein
LNSRSSLSVSNEIEEWEKTVEYQRWYLYEKTPIYWLKYFSDPNSKHPTVEAHQKIHLLEQLLKGVTVALGFGSK